MSRKRVEGLYAVTPEAVDSDWLCERVGGALAGGARVVQYRSKNSDVGLRRTQVKRLLALCRGRSALLIVNDDVALTRDVGADGVHLGRMDMSPTAARLVLGDAAVIGVSCYDSLARAKIAREAGADYVAFGSFFPSSVKPDAVRAPVGLLRAARATLDLPIVAIGGITADNAGALIEAGADALAVVSALFHVPDSLAAARAFTALFEARERSLCVGSNP